ncbi:DnaJ domain-containing protein [Polynucleobacter sp. AP-Capit-er-40B-B4]|uniref:J domain-containing protein n=1 Tax=Polynucleobacter sp. AP-Capit-er-40B-B4 TaxID=2576927 RepID=UPI001C0D87D6|nr:DnaJ domain-containing protein [Polynucleobacter sp. AP-Capit-er-40B-B4]MBU3580778.1 DnaJ domain-containing protein [Polynucleobacter sp. AP-Capit-er-40B-B4]
MSSNDWYVVIVLALVGYWGTSAVIRFFKKENDWTSAQSNSGERASPPDKSDGAWYLVLDLPSSASMDEVKAAYKRKISMYHPDKVSTMGPEFNEIAQRKTKQINAAYDEAIRSFNN